MYQGGLLLFGFFNLFSSDAAGVLQVVCSFFDLETPCLEMLMRMLNTPQFLEYSPLIDSGEINENSWKLTEEKIHADDTEACFYEQ